ncbi:Type II secretion system protein D [Polaromonas vacuolata]|uniref:Type II secretion system protein D n=1 Tax=Polaromonas vacuolata TaxID=37448 RepID=A0A6H2HE20_9BURK|nr:pilus (MSHA type) biogenesis protein MshL [Polaromonas vacuolata]QJC58043.1 Type II secretion system protein D [Polaromonas vacuolata]
MISQIPILPPSPVLPRLPQRFVLSSVCALTLLGLLSACSVNRPLRTPDVGAVIRAEIKPEAPAPVTELASAEAAALASGRSVPPPELKIDLLVNNAPVRDVFLALVSDTRYSMLLHPDVAGTLSVALRNVTLVEALESIRDVYGYDFRIDGQRITIYAPTLQTRIFTVNYPISQRTGSSELRVSSGTTLAPNNGVGSSGASGQSIASSGANSNQGEGSRVVTASKTDLWSELANAARSLIGPGEGRNVVTSPQAGIMAVRAMPSELREVEKFLKAAQISVQRQVMLEAKIVEVELRDGFQGGIDWSILRNRSNSFAAGTISGNTSSASSRNALVSGVQPGLPGFSGGPSALAGPLSLPAAGAGLFGLAFAGGGFQAVLGFLETQGDVQILSSPRIATLNNQKAVLKVGNEDFFVTNVSSTSTPIVGAAGTVGNSQPAVTLTPFFSGISLDVTPQIDSGNSIMLHVHPSVTTVTEKNRQIDLGNGGSYNLPLASSSVNETDTMVKIIDGNIVAIGGLMQIQSSRQSSGLPGSGDNTLLANLFGNRVNSGRKKEVVVLIKPTIIRTAEDWESQTRRASTALDEMDTVRARVIRIDGSFAASRPKVPAPTTPTPVPALVK